MTTDPATAEAVTGDPVAPRRRPDGDLPVTGLFDTGEDVITEPASAGWAIGDTAIETLGVTGGMSAPVAGPVRQHRRRRPR